LRSIVISGLKETGGTSKEKRTHLKEVTEGLIDFLEIDTEISSTYRLGMEKEGKNSLVKVIFPNSKMQQLVLRRAKNLRKDQTYNGVYLRPSLTPEAQLFEYNLRKELRQMRDGGTRCRIIGWPPGDPSRKIEEENC
jgi:hypothetical protein